VLGISRRLIDVVKVRNIVHIEAGMQMMALALSISSEVCNVDSFKVMNFYLFLRTAGCFLSWLQM
jgi:hypothetical protein